MTETYYQSEHKGEVIDRMIRDHLTMENNNLDAQALLKLDNEAVRSREVSQGDGEIQIGGVTMVTKTQSQWENMGGSYADNTLYVVVEN